MSCRHHAAHAVQIALETTRITVHCCDQHAPIGAISQQTVCVLCIAHVPLLVLEGITAALHDAHRLHELFRHATGYTAARVVIRLSAVRRRAFCAIVVMRSVDDAANALWNSIGVFKPPLALVAFCVHERGDHALDLVARRVVRDRPVLLHACEQRVVKKRVRVEKRRSVKAAALKRGRKCCVRMHVDQREISQVLDARDMAYVFYWYRGPDLRQVRKRTDGVPPWSDEVLLCKCVVGLFRGLMMTTMSMLNKG